MWTYVTIWPLSKEVEKVLQNKDMQVHEAVTQRGREHPESFLYLGYSLFLRPGAFLLCIFMADTPFGGEAG